jgi:hypothetical protein
MEPALIFIRGDVRPGPGRKNDQTLSASELPSRVCHTSGQAEFMQFFTKQGLKKFLNL